MYMANIVLVWNTAVNQWKYVFVVTIIKANDILSLR